MKKLIILLAFVLTSCNSSEDVTQTAQQSTALGEKLFANNCATCHGNKAQGITSNWKKPTADGSYPPPPLNGSAHTWHHSPELLLQVITDGGSKIGGVMPAFKDKLNIDEKKAILNYLYSLWPKDIKDKYNQRFNTNI